jgi:hypothetical protein
MRSRSVRYIPRRPSRHACRIPCQIVRPRDFKLIAESTLDISELGLLAVPNRMVLTGEEVLVSFMAPYSRTWIDAEGVVARVIHARREGDVSRAIGISFDYVDEIARAVLRQNLMGLPPPIMPRRTIARA